MTFWEFFNNHPIVGLLFAVPSIWCVALVAEVAVRQAAEVFKAKYGGCDCVVCDCAAARAEAIESCAALLDGMVDIDSSPKGFARHIRATLNGGVDAPR